MSTGGYNPSPPPQYGDSQQQQYGFKPPPYNPAVPEPVPVSHQPPATVVLQTVAAIPLGPESARLTCSSCGATVLTRVELENTTKTHLIALFLCLAGCWPCCLIPYCVDSCKNTNHYCSACNAFMGQYKR